MLGLVTQATLDEALAGVKRLESLRQSDAARAADILADEKAKGASLRASLDVANRSLTELETAKVNQARLSRETLIDTVSEGNQKLAILQAAYTALQSAFDAEATRHSETRSQAHSEALAHAETAARLATLLKEYANLKKAHGDAVSDATAARAQADLEVEASRSLIEHLTKESQ